MKRTSAIASLLNLTIAVRALAAADAPSVPTNNRSETNATPAVLPEVTVRERREEPTAYKIPDAATATKTDTPIMQTPVSVQVVPQQVLNDQQVLRLDDALQNVSGVVRTSDGFGTSDSYSIRGFSQMMVTYEDGIRVDQYTTAGFARDMANVDRIEVIKGPASVLYGRAEPGGLVNIVTKKPLDDPYYSIQQQIGSYDLYRSSLDATGPLNDGKTWLYRLNAAYENAGSFRDFIHTDRTFLFPTIQWRPDAKNQVTAEFKYATGTDMYDMGLPFMTNGNPANVPISRNYVEPDANHCPTQEYSAKLSASHAFDDDWKLRLLYKSEYHDAPTPNAQYYSGQADGNGDLPRYWMGSPAFNHLTHQVMLDLTGKFETFGVKHTAIAGFDYYHQQGGYGVVGPNSATNPPSINIYNPIYGQLFPPLDPTASGAEHSGQDGYGAYLQDQMELPANLHLLAGLRYDQAFTFETGTFFTADSHDTPPVTPRLGILWQAVPQVSLYATYTENFGATPLGSQTWEHGYLPAESAQQYEFGVKTEWFEKRLSAMASIYQLTKQNIATADPNPDHPNASIAVGEVRSRGVEVDVAGQIAPGWRVIGGYSYIDIITTKDNNGLEGLRFPSVPFNSGSLWTTYEVQMGGLKGLKFGAGLVYRGSEVDYSNNRIPSYSIVNVMAGYDWRIGKHKLSAQVNVNNLLDRNYFTSVSYISAYPGAPINALGSVRWEF